MEETFNELEGCGENVTKMKKISALQLSLPEEYDTVTAYFDALPVAERTYTNFRARFIHEFTIRSERAKKEESGTDSKGESEQAAFLSKSKHDRGGKSNQSSSSGKYRHNYSRGNIRCNACRKFGHIARHCNESNSSDSGTIRCFTCGREGHIAKFCRGWGNDNFNRRKRSKRAFITVDLGLFTSDSGISSKRESDNRIGFFVDRGASDTMISSKWKQYLRGIKYFDEPVEIYCSKRNVKLISKCSGDLDVNFNGFQFSMRDALCVEELNSNLLSVRRIDDLGYSIRIEKGNMYFYDSNGELLIVGNREHGLYSVIFELDNVVETQANACFRDDKNEKIRVWHKRFAHLGYDSIIGI